MTYTDYFATAFGYAAIVIWLGACGLLYVHRDAFRQPWGK